MNTVPSPPGERLLRIADVEARTGLRKSSIYAWMRVGKFPACVRLGARTSAWPSTSIDAWIASRIKARAGNAAGTSPTVPASESADE